MLCTDLQKYMYMCMDVFSLLFCRKKSTIYWCIYIQHFEYIFCEEKWMLRNKFILIHTYLLVISASLKGTWIKGICSTCKSWGCYREFLIPVYEIKTFHCAKFGPICKNLDLQYKSMRNKKHLPGNTAHNPLSR